MLPEICHVGMIIPFTLLYGKCGGDRSMIRKFISIVRLYYALLLERYYLKVLSIQTFKLSTTSNSILFIGVLSDAYTHPVTFDYVRRIEKVFYTADPKLVVGEELIVTGIAFRKGEN